MKKSILNIGTALNKAEQKNTLGGRDFNFKPTGPCGETGGKITRDDYYSCWGYGYMWHQNQCWICY